MTSKGTFDLGPIYEGYASGDEVRWDDLRFPAQGIDIVGPSAPPSRETDTGLLIFSASAVNTIAGVAQMPHAWLEESTIVPHVHWQKTSATSPTGNVLWQFDYEVVNNGSVAAMDYGTQLQTSSVVAGTPDDGAANRILISSFGNVSMRNYDISCIIFWKLSRIGNDAADTATMTARLVEFDLHYIVDGRGSQQQFTKTDWGK